MKINIEVKTKTPRLPILSTSLPRNGAERDATEYTIVI